MIALSAFFGKQRCNWQISLLADRLVSVAEPHPPASSGSDPPGLVVSAGQGAWVL